MKRTVFFTIAILAFAASMAMYIIGKDSSHLSELYDVFWMPLPLGVLCLFFGLMSKKKEA